MHFSFYYKAQNSLSSKLNFQSYDVTLLIMEDVLVLLSSKNGKYSFFGENNAVLTLQSCHLSENAQDAQR